MTGAAVEGTCTPRFRAVREMFTRRIEGGEELGASLCVMQGEDVVVDLWGGTADAASWRPWEKDTVANTYSLTKTMTALAALVLIDRDLLDPDAAVADYWPEFAAAGKGRGSGGRIGEGTVLVRHVLGHTSGLAGWSQPVRIEDVYDTPSAAALLAAQEPWWPPGDGSGYHAISFGTLVGELVQRITGKTLGTFFATEIAEPLGADYWIGAPSELLDAPKRIATMVAPPSSGFDLTSLPVDNFTRRTLTNPAFSPELTTSPDFLAAELGGVNGQGHARSVARIQSILTNSGTMDGHRFVKSTTIDRIFERQSDGIDRVLGVPVRFGLGWALPSESMPGVPLGKVCWWTGFGGSVVSADLHRGITVAYVMNRMAPELVGAARPNAYLDAVYSAV